MDGASREYMQATVSPNRRFCCTRGRLLSVRFRDSATESEPAERQVSHIPVSDNRLLTAHAVYYNTRLCAGCRPHRGGVTSAAVITSPTLSSASVRAHYPRISRRDLVADGTYLRSYVSSPSC